jgi:hypothetical protein
VFSGRGPGARTLRGSARPASVDLLAATETHDSGLFLSAGHRVNLLADAYREIGIAQVEAQFTHTNGITYNASMLTEKFARSGRTCF